MARPKIRAVFFDAVGTLIHPSPPAPQVYAEVGRRFGSRLDTDEIARRFPNFFQAEEDADFRAGLATSETRELRRWRNIVAGVLDDVTDSDGCFRALYEHFSKPEAWQCDPAARSTIDELVERGSLVGMASNYDHRLRSLAAGLEPLRRIQHLAISSELGWRKPAPQFFEAVSAMVQLAPDAILYVGDDRVNDYEGASRAGMRAVLLDNAAGGALYGSPLNELVNDALNE